VTGRKRHLVVDTLGLLLAVVVHAANVQDRDGAKLVLAKLAGRFPRLGLLWADGGYAGTLLVWALAVGGWVIELVKKPAGATTFAVLPKRWIVERTFAWISRCRRLARDFERYARTVAAFIRLAMIRVMLKRLTATHSA
jgi:putative transposase